MRISTSSMFANSTAQLGTLQSQMARTQQQLATQHRMLSPADDPIASARVLEVTQSQSINAQFATNRASARSSLSQEEVALTGVQDLIGDAQTLAVAANNGTNSASDRATMANELAGRLDDLMGLANTSDGNGSYLFGGYKSNAAPFVQTNGGVTYQGDQGQVLLQVGSARKVSLSDSGSSVFEGIATGNGAFVTAATTTPVPNSGSGVISAGAVTDPSKLTGHRYQIDFSAPAGVSSYTVTDLTSGSTVPPAPAVATQAYISGAPINVDGMSFAVTGAPAAGDSFGVQPSSKQSLFTTLSDMIAALRAPANTPAEKQALSASLGKANVNLNAALDNVLTVRSSVGTRQKELDTLDTAGLDTDVQYAATLSGLQDLDVVKAISQFTQQQATLEAAQKTFKTLSG
ncbi:MAG: flagellar hook-associated protein FlgL, partial [Pseudomonadota bacterium]|nr:flagellar hook-associated protein FlgL [Pseudomonadota bacterium]